MVTGLTSKARHMSFGKEQRPGSPGHFASRQSTMTAALIDGVPLYRAQSFVGRIEGKGITLDVSERVCYKLQCRLAPKQAFVVAGENSEAIAVA